MNTSIAACPNIQQRPHESILGIGYELLIGAAETGGGYELMKFVVPAGHGPPPHIHTHEDECFYVADGEFEIVLGNTVQKAPAGSFTHLPRGKSHTFRNVSDQPATLLCWVVPGRLQPFFDGFKRDWPASDPTPPSVCQEDIEKLMMAAKRHEIEILA